mmetsp:Transcript_64424/g.185115  ORF Transcript_64424/g.185115 Transcript_64424/m.185115 type:complete len:295 (+) Transcript_64424:724-1608(+)
MRRPEPGCAVEGRLVLVTACCRDEVCEVGEFVGAGAAAAAPAPAAAMGTLAACCALGGQAHVPHAIEAAHLVGGHLPCQVGLGLRLLLALGGGHGGGRCARGAGVAAARRNVPQDSCGRSPLHLDPLSAQSVARSIHEHGVRSCRALRTVREAHEAEAAGALGASIHHHHGIGHRPVAGEACPQVLGVRILRQAPDEDLVGGPLLRVLPRHGPLHVDDAAIQPLGLREGRNGAHWRVEGDEAEATGPAVLGHHNRIHQASVLLEVEAERLRRGLRGEATHEELARQGGGPGSAG